MCIEEGPNPLPFHGQFEANFWESVSQLNKTVNTHFSSQASMGNLPFHGQFEADFWESVSQLNKTVNTHFSSQASTGNFSCEDLEMSSVYKDGKMEPFTERVSKKMFYSII